KWMLYKSIPYVVNNADGAPIGITFMKTFTNENGQMQVDSDYIQLDFDSDKVDVSEYLSKYNTPTSMVTVAPEDLDSASSVSGALRSTLSPLKKITSSISEIKINQTFKTGTNIFCTLRKEGDLYGIDISSVAKAEHFVVNIQALYGNEVVLATYDRDDHQKEDGSGTHIFIEFPEGTDFPNDTATSLFVEVIVDPRAHAHFVKGAVRGEPK
ncbi:hypothetical protein, partial [Vibrio anguillarum]